MSSMTVSGFCERAGTDCTFDVAITNNSDLENNPRQKIEIGRISCQQAKIIKCNPRNCPVLKSNNLSF